ncbi:hypothetical protein GGR56DRAFT_654265 [Xylariaceae sp. FL0804]|nr:hypothetical protein GGR56DRAFT_654265 [Xylariaceae sp. FL0804]
MAASVLEAAGCGHVMEVRDGAVLGIFWRTKGSVVRKSLIKVCPLCEYECLIAEADRLTRLKKSYGFFDGRDMGSALGLLDDVDEQCTLALNGALDVDAFASVCHAARLRFMEWNRSYSAFHDLLSELDRLMGRRVALMKTAFFDVPRAKEQDRVLDEKMRSLKSKLLSRLETREWVFTQMKERLTGIVDRARGCCLKRDPVEPGRPFSFQMETHASALDVRPLNVKPHKSSAGITEEADTQPTEAESKKQTQDAADQPPYSPSFDSLVNDIGFLVGATHSQVYR